MVSLKKSITLGGTLNVAMVAVRQVLTDLTTGNDPGLVRLDPKSRRSTWSTAAWGNYRGD